MSRVLVPAVLAAATLLAGCGSMQSLTSEVSSYGTAWPAGRAPGGSFAFERLPSQQAELTLQQQLEDAARPALAQAGFTPAAEGQPPSVSVQLSLRNVRYERLDPWGGGAFWGPPWGRRPYGWPGMWGPGWWGPVQGTPWYEREVQLVVRDRAGGQVLYEGRARSDGVLAGSPRLYEAMFRAAMQDFPEGSPRPRRVDVPLQAASQPSP